MTVSGIDQQLDRITHYEDGSPLVPECTTSRRQLHRSPTLDDLDEFISDRPLGLISNASLPHTEPSTTWDVVIEGDTIKEVSPHNPTRIPSEYTNSINAASALLTPSLCHPHVHLDKAFLLSHPRHSHLRLQEGGFDEAMNLTGRAKANFTQDDIVERGQRLLDESIAAGVTHIRAFVELDIVVGTKCLDAALLLKRRMERRSGTHIQICAFAQLPLFTTSQGDQEGKHIRHLLTQAATSSDVDVVGSTPYVEEDERKMQQNIEWTIDLAVKERKHLDFHLDYNLDPHATPMIWHVLGRLKHTEWRQANPGKTIMLGHCTRLTLFDSSDWEELKNAIGDLPISFVGLPTSDLFMMQSQAKALGTLDVPKLIKEYGLNACIGINNIGNAFTPQGTCDPLSLASMGVGIYQAGTEDDAELLFQCVSTRARQAIGVGNTESDSPHATIRNNLSVQAGDPADLLLFRNDSLSPWRTPRSVSEAVYLYDGAGGRRLCASGRLVSG